MLTPMLVQYLVGLCCLRWDPNAVDVTLGDMVLDPAAGKERDVDVTVTIDDGPNGVRAFKAYEVKRERSPLDVADVEQLCLKLADMPSITERAIVSASGFTDGARSKAAHHGIDLYELRPWSRPIQEQFPVLAPMTGLPEECLRFSKTLLFWVNPQFRLFAPSAPRDFSVEASDPLLNADGNRHSKFPSFATLQAEIQLRSTEILFPLEPAATILRTFPIQPLGSEEPIAVGPAWPHTHTLDIGRDEVYVNVGGQPTKLEALTINGHLQWQTTNEKPLYYVMERVPTGEAFASAMVALGQRPGTMFGLLISPKSRTMGVHNIRLAEKHWAVIRKLKIEVPSDPGTEP